MEVDRIHPGALSDQALDTAVVIDVLRATSTAVVLLARGAAAVRLVAEPHDLGSLEPAPAATPYLVFSELDASRGYGLRCVDNSPHLAGQLELAGCLPVLVTTNGTRAVAAAMQRARAVLVAGFVNLSSTARHLHATARRVTLLPAGDFAACEPRTEDERCADALEGMLAGGAVDLARLVAECRADARVQRRIARHPDLVADIAVALTVDRHDLVAAAAVRGGGGVDLVRADQI